MARYFNCRENEDKRERNAEVFGFKPLRDFWAHLRSILW